MSTATNLRRAKALIDAPKKWCQVHYKIGTRKCTYGALNLACKKSRDFLVEENFLFAAAQELGFRNPTNLNDESDHATVMKMFDRAIELAEVA